MPNILCNARMCFSEYCHGLGVDETSCSVAKGYAQARDEVQPQIRKQSLDCREISSVNFSMM